MNNYQLNTKWCLWYHSINDTSWKNSSYKNLYTFENLYDIKNIQDSIQKIHLQNGMFFIMREDIFQHGKTLKIEKDVVFHIRYQVIIIKSVE